MQEFKINEYPSILVVDFSTIPGKYPSISDIYLRFIIAPSAGFGKLSSKYIKSLRFSHDLRYNLEVNAIKSEEFFVALFDVVYFHLMDLWS